MTNKKKILTLRQKNTPVRCDAGWLQITPGREQQQHLKGLRFQYLYVYVSRQVNRYEMPSFANRPSANWRRRSHKVLPLPVRATNSSNSIFITQI